MKSLHDLMAVYRTQMLQGDIPAAYQGLMHYLLDLRSYFEKKYPTYTVSGSLYAGYMDMTYFALSPPSLKRAKLKVAVVFLHPTCRFEIWLAGLNKTVQNTYWKLFQERGWEKYRIPPTIKGADSILEFPVVKEPDFRDLGDLTQQIERGAVAFIHDVEEFLSTR